MRQTSTYGYDLHGNWVKKTLANGKVVTQDLDAPNRLVGIEGQKPVWLAAAVGLEVFRFADQTAGRRSFVARLDRRAVEEEAALAGVVPIPEEMDAGCSHLRKGWYWGSQAAERLSKVSQRILGKPRERGYRASLEQKAHDLGKAEAMLGEGMRAAGMTPGMLAQTPGSDPRKVAIARAIWENSTVGQDWLARTLHMGSAANVSQQIRRQKQQNSP